MTNQISVVLDEEDDVLEQHVVAHSSGATKLPSNAASQYTSQTRDNSTHASLGGKREGSFVFEPVRQLSALQPMPVAPVATRLASPMNNNNPSSCDRTLDLSPAQTQPTTPVAAAGTSTGTLARRSIARSQAAMRSAKRAHVKSCTCAKCRRLARHRQSQPTRFKFKTTTTITLVDVTFGKNGLARARGDEDDWCVLWTVNFRLHQFRALKSNQKVNQFPCTAEITRKDQLCRNVLRMQEVSTYSNDTTPRPTQILSRVV
jgi:hypothetical protein